MFESHKSQLVYNNSIKSTNEPPINDRILIPYFSLYSDRMVIHPRPFAPIFKRKKNANSLDNLKKHKFTGKLSRTQQNIIKKKLTSWLTSIQIKNESSQNRYQRKIHYPVFITITLASKQQHPDKEIKRRLLDLFIKRLKKEFDIDKYFWKAERQINGNIHFHLIVDKYCNWHQLRTIWNQVQNMLGYVDRFENIHKHRNPNSADVRSASKVDNFINYVLKYCLKNGKGKPIEGRIFGMSDKLRNLGVFQDVLDSELSDLILRYIKNNYFTVYRQEYFTVLLFNKAFYKSSFYNLLQKYSTRYYLKIYDFVYLPAVEKITIKKPFVEKLITQSTQLSMFKLSDQIKVINTYNYVRAGANLKYLRS